MELALVFTDLHVEIGVGVGVGVGWGFTELGCREITSSVPKQQGSLNK
jgi:hypothetical protein